VLDWCSRSLNHFDLKSALKVCEWQILKSMDHPIKTMNLPMRAYESTTTGMHGVALTKGRGAGPETISPPPALNIYHLLLSPAPLQARSHLLRHLLPLLCQHAPHARQRREEKLCGGEIWKQRLGIAQDEAAWDALAALPAAPLPAHDDAPKPTNTKTTTDTHTHTHLRNGRSRHIPTHNLVQRHSYCMRTG